MPPQPLPYGCVPFWKNAGEEQGGVLQRLFHPTFPASWPGVGLLLLRAAIGVTLIAQGSANFGNSQRPDIGVWGISLLAVASGALLVIGFFTRLTAILVGLEYAGFAFSSSSAATLSFLDSGLATVFAVVIAVAIVLLGPGAFSLDSRLFGRREIIIPPASDSSKP